MNALKILLAAILGLSIGLYSCDDGDMHNELSQEDLLALTGLREAYTNAFDENGALQTSVQQNDADGIHLHDSLFHHFEGLFEDHHGNYSHANGHDDQHHDVDGMHMGNTMNGHNDKDGHHDDDHELMDGLRIDHESIHTEI